MEDTHKWIYCKNCGQSDKIDMNVGTSSTCDKCKHSRFFLTMTEQEYKHYKEQMEVAGIAKFVETMQHKGFLKYD